ncbi:aminopeptidase P family protein [Massilia sp. W12]|uniref:aminopeptidase P family protein n=1 Tax=Massilia sp. W12 TaxID=3126507 RepID=UPI0030D2885C
MNTLSEQHVAHARIAALRAAMQRQQVHACLIPSSDPHLSEYLPERWQGRVWASGFTGSVGLLIVTLDFAGLWADSRYWAQAEAELAGSGIALMKINTAGSLQYVEWLAQNLKPGQRLAVDGAILGLGIARQIEQALQSCGASMAPECDLLQEVWSDRPPLPDAPVYEHLPPYATQSRAAKLAALRAEMRAQDCAWHLISTVDDIGWLFNLRGADVNYNPVFLAHACIGLEQATLFVGAGKIAPELAARLAADGVTLQAYEAAFPAFAALPSNARVLLDPRRVTYGLRQALPAGVSVVEAVNPTVFAKSKKSAAELAHVRAAMEQDGAALCEFFSWLESALAQGAVTELEVDAQITAARARRPGFVCPSFGTIAGFNANGALPHYRATPAAHARIEGDGLLLIDSGGQYLGGTTDITRVVAVGQVNAAQKRDCSLVLQGMMALSRAQFPRGLKSPMLDAIARAPIWAAGIDYGHGTGHGVGYFMNVHEGPQSIAQTTMPEAHTAMEEGMITSVEPGIYRPGQWGVRIENLVYARHAVSGQFGDFLSFETLTLCPIDTRCLDLEILRADEKAWLNAYHQEVQTRLLPHVSGAAREWLLLRTAAV